MTRARDLSSILAADGSLNISTSVNLADNEKAYFGTSNDLEIYHDGSNSYISEGGTGNLFLGATNLFLRSGTGETYIGAVQDGAVSLYHDNSAKLATTSTGVDVTGNATFPDNGKAIFGAGSDLAIYHSGTNSIIEETSGSGSLIIKGTNISFEDGTGAETYATFIKDGAATIRYDNATKLTTTATGVDVTGNATFPDNGKAIFGAGSDLQIYHDAGNSRIVDAGTGNLNLQADNNINILNNAVTELKAQFITDGAVNLFYDNSKKLATTATGVDVTGTVTADGLTVDGDVSFTSSNTTDQFIIENTNTGSGSAPDMVLYRNSTSPADGDVIGRIDYRGKDDGALDRDYITLYSKIADASTGSAGGSFHIQTRTGVTTADRFVISGSGDVGIGTTSPSNQLEVTGGTDRAVISVTNADLGNLHYTNREGRYLTSNGSGWSAADGVDPGIVIGGDNSSGEIKGVGIVLHNDNNGDNQYSPTISFGSKSNSGSYNTTYAHIIGRKTGQAADSNWSAGELGFYTQPVNGYVTNVARMKIDSEGRVTMPYQPAFEVTLPTAIAVGNNMVYNTVVTNIGNHWNSSSNSFVAPVNGFYSFAFQQFTDRTTAAGDTYWDVMFNGAYRNRLYQSKNGSTNSHLQCNAAFCFYMNANDSVLIRYTAGVANSTGGTDHNKFSGFLVG